MKRVVSTIILIAISILFTACDPKVQAQINSDLASRASYNIEIIGQLQDEGLIEKESADKFKADISEKSDAIKNIKDAREYKKYISWYINGSKSNSGLTYKTTVSNDMGLPNNGLKGTEQTPGEVLNIIGQSYVQELQTMLNYNVKEMKVTGNVSLDEVVSAITNIKTAIASGDEADVAKKFERFKQYFSGDAGKLLVNEPIIAKTTLGPTETWNYSDETNTLQVNSLSGENKLIGYDFRIKGASGIPEIAIRLEEFSATAIEKLLGKDGIAKDEYLTYNKVIYNLKYPINIINSIEVDPSDATKYITTLAVTPYYLNLYTGEITDSQGNKLTQDGDILKIGGTGLQGEVGQSSFMVHENKIVLKDYLEFSYMPGVVDNEKWVALGRRVRINSLSGNINDTFATVVDKDGNVAIESPKLCIADLLSSNSGLEGNINYEGKALKLGQNTASTIESTASQDEDGSGLLKETYSNAIYPVIRLGSLLIAREDTDAGTNGKMVLYGICVDKNPFTNGMYDSWIKGEDSGFGNLSWWLNWLGANDYRYRIDANALSQFLMNNYSFEMREEGYIIIDTEVVSKIQKQYNIDDKSNRVNGIRTAFAVLGFLLMAYALILVGAWGFDSNIVTGPRLMSILTFNKWEAIQDSTELPQMEIADKHYMTFGKTIQKCILIMAIGYLLTVIDIVKIVALLINAFGGIGDIISKIIFGNK